MTQNEVLGFSIEEGDPFASDFLAFYRQRTGRDYHDDAGHPGKMARKILKRGTIADETEYRLIDGIAGNAEQTVFKQSEIAAVNDMLATFGEAAKTD